LKRKHILPGTTTHFNYHLSRPSVIVSCAAEQSEDAIVVVATSRGSMSVKTLLVAI